MRALRRAAVTAGMAAVVALAAGCAAAPPRLSAQALVERLAASAAGIGGRVGVLVVDAGDGTVLGAHDATVGFVPASNQKLLTAAVALATLGPEHRLGTELLAAGSLQDGVLRGDLVLRGGGDPTLGTDASGDPELAGFVRAVRAGGVRSVAGAVVGDGAWLGEESLGRGWQWDHLDQAYAAPFGGLCCHGNVQVVTVRPAAAHADVRIVPAGETAGGPGVALVPAGAPTEVTVRRRLHGDQIEVAGAIARDAAEQVFRVPVRDPALQAARSLADALQAGGVAVDGWRTGAMPADGPPARVVHVHESPPVAALVRTMLQDSDNLFAEQLWRVAAKRAGGDGGSESAERHGKDVLAQLGVDCAGMVLADGSGLSRRNLLRPAHLVAVLRAMHGSPQGVAWLESLPLAGVSGTLRSRFAAGPAHARVRAKTGSLARVVCLSGYVPRPDPAAPPFVFSVLWNDFLGPDEPAMAAVDAFVQDLARAAGW